MSTDLPSGAAPLPQWGVIRADGADAASFLNGQLTSDVASLRADGARLAGYCSAKGRLLASFVVWRPADDQLMLACSADLLPAVMKRLSMFVLRARCKLSDASASHALFGLAGAPAAESLGTDGEAPVWSRRRHGDADLLRLPDAGGLRRWLWCGGAGAAPAGLPVLTPADWDLLEVESGVARIVAATSDQFVPQMLNFEAVGGVDFQKGCYPGQEVVARSQYRGTIKRRTLRFDVVGAEAAPGDEVYAVDDPQQPAGMVVNAALRGNGRTSLLVEVKLAAADAALHLRGIDGARLQPAALPYPLPSGDA